jgi:hypothetical protein
MTGRAVPWLRRLVADLSPRIVHMGFVVDKVALGQVFPRVLRCSITRKNEETDHLHHRVAQEASRLRCVRSICCGALHPPPPKKNMTGHWTKSLSLICIQKYNLTTEVIGSPVR